MKSYRLDPTKVTFTLEDLPVPEPGPGQVLIKVEAAGLCRSDTHLVDGKGLTFLSPEPITLGHEVAGIITKFGSEPEAPHDHFKVGDKVAVALVGYPIEASDRKKTVGLGRDGGYSEYVVAHIEHLVKIPEGVSFPQAAVSTDSISTAYHATVATGGVTASSTVAIIGIGGLGLNALAIAALQGAKVYGIDINESKFEQAKHLGATDCGTALKPFSDAGVVFDVVVDFVGSSVTVTTALTALKKTGTLVLVGLDQSSVGFPTLLLVSKSISLRGSFGSAKDELEKVLHLIAAGKLSPVVTEIPFSDVPKGLADLNGDKIEGRLYVRPNKD